MKKYQKRKPKLSPRCPRGPLYIYLFIYLSIYLYIYIYIYIYVERFYDAVGKTNDDDFIFQEPRAQRMSTF